tara:strand:- start:6166 stop:7047 length:882 start_codon:yes stop_codon:yes gene_type:complete
MSFYNKREDVIDIQLTQYGKIALSQGKFRPCSYKFFDDDIVYDSMYAGQAEAQNDSEERILNFARKKPALSIYGSETKINETSLSGQQKDGTKQINANDVDTRMLLKNEIVTYPVLKQSVPTFTIQIKNSTTTFQTGSLTRTTSSYMNSSTQKIKMSVNVEELPPLASFTYGRPLQGGRTLITFSENLDFCKDEEFELRMYEIKKVPSIHDETKLVESLSNLYFNSSDAQHPLVSDRFMISADDAVEDPSKIFKYRKDCENSFKLSTKHGGNTQTVMRDLYEGFESQVRDCED